MANAVLIVGWDAELVEQARAAVQGTGLRVIVAKSANEGLDALTNHHPDLVLLIPNRQQFEAQIFLKLLPWNSRRQVPVVIAGKVGEYPNALHGGGDVVGFIENIENTSKLQEAIRKAIDMRIPPTEISPTAPGGMAFPLQTPLPPETVADENLPQRTKGKAHILVVDDEDEIAKMLKLMLESRGYTVTTAGNGMEAMSIARHNLPDLIIVDIMLPILDGFQVCRLLKFDQHFLHIPIIILTARSSPRDEATAREVGADLFMTKPVDGRSLLEAIEELLASRATPPPTPEIDETTVGSQSKG